MKLVYAIACGVSAFFAMNCGDGYGSGSGTTSSPSTQTEAPPAEPTTSGEVTAKVAVNGHTFDPPEVHVKQGETVRWVWVAGSHNVVSGAACTPDGTFTSGSSTQGPGSSFDHTFADKGTFAYYCDPHCGVGMTGKVVVE
jgi:plastocyanin